MKGEGFLPLSMVEMAKMLDAYQRAADMNLLTSITDKNGTILYVNELFCTVSKFKASELIGKNFRILKSGHHSEEFYEDLWNTIIAGNAWQGEILNRAKDGSMFWVDTVILPILDDEGNVLQFLSLRFPITDKKHLENERLGYTKELHGIVSAISHEIRNPIVNCIGILDIINDDEPPDSTEILALANYLKGNVLKLEAFTRELNNNIIQLQKKYANLLIE